MKQWRVLFFCLLLSIGMQRITWGESLSISARGAVLMDGNTGRVLYEKEGDMPLAMASTTKIMTAVLVLEQADLSDTVTVGSGLEHIPEVSLHIKEGEQYRLKDLLTAMMLRSYNDVAVCLAEYISGSTEAFCQMMTEKAAQIGAENTVFATPNGLDSSYTLEEHHSTAEDMALIARYALENETFREIIATKEIIFSDLSGSRSFSVTNADQFLSYPGALGVKTGFTNRAGHCFVGAAQREDIYLVSTVLGSGWGSRGKEAKWTDTKKLMEYGFQNYTNETVVTEGEDFGEISVSSSPTEIVSIEAEKDYALLLSEEEQVELVADYPESMEAPVYAGDQVGTLSVYLNRECLEEIPLVATEDALRYTLLQRLLRLMDQWCILYF